MTSTTAAPDELLTRKLRHASTEALIQALITLTHRVHGRDDAGADRMREQREHVISELKHRADHADHGTSGGAA